MYSGKKKYKILVIEDNSGDFSIVENFLIEQFINPDIVRAVTFKEAATILADIDSFFDAILLDLSLPDKNGRLLITDMLIIAASYPIIILTGFSDIEFSVNSIALGISDYLIKDDLNPTTLYKSIIYSINRKRVSRQLDEVSASIPGAVYQFLLKPDGSFSFPFVSKSIAKLSGITADEVYSDPNALFANIHSDDLAPVMESIETSALQLSPWLHFFRYMQKPDTKIKWVRGNSMPSKLSDGSVLWNGTFIDVTETKEAEEKVLQMNEQLRNLSAHLETIREDERTLLARELHDELGQQLTIVKMNLFSLLKKNTGLSANFKEQAAAIVESINQTMDAVRKIATDLRPVILDEHGLADALRWRSNEFSRKTGIPSTIEIIGNEIIADENTNTQVFRIYQEALTNVARHSNASQVGATLKKENGFFKFLIADNGNGFNPGKLKEKKSLGLLMMQERAASIGATFKIFSEPGQGTSILLTIPLKSES